MNTGVAVLLCVVAGVAAGIAVAAGTNEAVVVPAAAVAVGAGALLLVGVVEQTRWPSPRPRTASTPDLGHVRSSVGAGAHGRTELIALLDHLDRASGGPRLASRSSEELAHLQALSPEEFRAYLSARVGELERRT